MVRGKRRKPLGIVISGDNSDMASPSGCRATRLGKGVNSAQALPLAETLFPLDSRGRFRWNEFARLHFTRTTERPALDGGFFISGVFASPRMLTNQRDASRRVTGNPELIPMIREET